MPASAQRCLMPGKKPLKCLGSLGLLAVRPGSEKSKHSKWSLRKSQFERAESGTSEFSWSLALCSFQTLCILANIADGTTAKELIMTNDDILQKIKYYMVGLCPLSLLYTSPTLKAGTSNRCRELSSIVKMKQQQVLETVPLAVLPSTPQSPPLSSDYLPLIHWRPGIWFSVSPIPALPQGFIPMWSIALALWQLFFDSFTFKHIYNLLPNISATNSHNKS